MLCERNERPGTVGEVGEKPGIKQAPRDKRAIRRRERAGMLGFCKEPGRSHERRSTGVL
jgi:hypothetical protein